MDDTYHVIHVYHVIYIGYVCCAVLSHFSHVWLRATLWALVLLGFSVRGIVQIRILEQVACIYGWYICKIHVSGLFSTSEEYVCIYHLLFSHSSIDGHWGGSTFWLKSAAVNIGVQMPVEVCFGGRLSQKLPSTGGHREQLALSFLVEKISVADKRDFY